MALPRGQVSDGLLSELDRFEQLIRPLTEEEWDRPSRCGGWSVGDVARHVVGSIADVAAGNLDGLGTPEVTQREVDEAWAATAPGGYEGSLGDGVEALWYDTWLHADDVRAATGRPSEPGDSLVGAQSHVAFELRKRGQDDTVVGDPFTWVLIATGRADGSPLGDAAPSNIYA